MGINNFKEALVCREFEDLIITTDLGKLLSTDMNALPNKDTDLYEYSHAYNQMEITTLVQVN